MPRPFVFVLHHHQPPGNLPSVMADAHARCYRPLLAALEAHDRVRVVLHFSGALLEWMVREDAAFVGRLRALVGSGRAEILGGGFYDPILGVLPDQDATGQLEMMAMFLERYVGVRPTGAWLAERVWDADLPRLLAPAGVTHTFVDDHHFKGVGLESDQINGSYVTDKAGHALRLLPISKRLRYAIPFNGPDEVIRTIVEAPGTGAMVYADDAEKLGFWPDTHRWVFEDGWLDRFFVALTEAQDDGRITMQLASEVCAAPPVGRVYLGGGGYDSLGAWALPAEAQLRRAATAERLTAAGFEERAVPIETGAPWPSFLAKYPEADKLYQKMLRVSGRLQDQMEIAIEESETGRLEGDVGDLLGTAQRDLYRGQCACVYWHGLFGGLYLGHLRRASFGALINAERIIDRMQQGSDDFVAYEQVDVDLDGHDEIIIANRAVEIIVHPARGGTLSQFDDKRACVDVADVMARHHEPYHSGLVPPPPVDRFRRALMRDRMLPAEANDAMIRDADQNVIFDVADRTYRVESLDVLDDDDVQTGVALVLVADGDGVPLHVEKRIFVAMESAGIETTYRIRNAGDARIEGTWLIEIPTTFVGSPADAENSDGRIVDRGTRLDVQIEAVGARRRGGPLVGVTQREDGPTETLLGYVTTLAFPIDLAPGADVQFTVRIALERTKK